MVTQIGPLLDLSLAREGVMVLNVLHELKYRYWVFKPIDVLSPSGSRIGLSEQIRSMIPHMFLHRLLIPSSSYLRVQLVLIVWYYDTLGLRVLTNEWVIPDNAQELVTCLLIVGWFYESMSSG